MDDHTEDGIRRLIDFLMEIDLDLAEFTVLTPFPHTQAYADLKRQNRILSFDWNDYSADQVVFQPKHMSPEALQGLLQYAWDTFYAHESQPIKMFKLFKHVVQKEMQDGTFRPRDRGRAKAVFGRPLGSG